MSDNITIKAGECLTTEPVPRLPGAITIASGYAAGYPRHSIKLSHEGFFVDDILVPESVDGRLQLLEGVRALLYENPALHARLRRVRLAIRLCMVGSCGCVTKTPDPAFHESNCRYKLLYQAESILIGESPA